MHEFKYKRNEFYCEATKITDIARRVETPFYLYSHKTLLDHYHKLKTAFSSVYPLICFSMKANSNLTVCKTLVNEGAGLDIVSGGELFKALKIGANPRKIVYAGVGKKDKEIKEAVRAGILLFNVESLPELALINKVAKGLDKNVDVSLRINPDIDPRTQKHISTGRGENKFGIDPVTARDIFLRRADFPHLKMVGLHIHIGSQITHSQPFVKAIKKVMPLIKELKGSGVPLKWFNIGGGLGINYRENEKTQTAGDFARKVLPLLKKTDLRIILEPGRFIAGPSGILVTKVLYIKETPFKRFVIVDAGMNDLLRPSLYEAYHEILPLVKSKKKCRKYDVVGPICESGDFLAKDRSLPEPEAGDLLAIMGTGAYGFTMASNYNSRPRAAEVLVAKDKFYVVRGRQSYKDLIREESILEISER